MTFAGRRAFFLTPCEIEAKQHNQTLVVVARAVQFHELGVINIAAEGTFDYLKIGTVAVGRNLNPASKPFGEIVCDSEVMEPWKLPTCAARQAADHLPGLGR